jgi:hypothetical protein
MNSLQKSFNLINVSQAINILATFGNQYGEALAKFCNALNLNFIEWSTEKFSEFETMEEIIETPIWDRRAVDAFSLIPLADIHHCFTNRKLKQKDVKGSQKGDTIITIITMPNGAYEKADFADNPTSLPLEDPIMRTYVHMVKNDSNRAFMNIYNNLDDYPKNVEGFFEPAMPNVAGWVRKFDLSTFLCDQQEVITAITDILPKMV